MEMISPIAARRLDTALASDNCRRGFSLIEVVVCIAIIATLLGLLLGAIGRVREAAARISTCNQARQIGLAIQSFAAQHEGRLPSLDGDLKSHNPFCGMFVAILPYIDGGDAWNRIRPDDPPYVKFKFFRAEYDPTIEYVEKNRGLSRGSSSFAANARLFSGCPALGLSLPDGAAHTIAIAQRYACLGEYDRDVLECSIVTFRPAVPLPPLPPTACRTASRRPSFADDGWGDVVPVTANGATIPSVAGKTFQCRPTIENADPTLSHSPFRGCMIVVAADASVKLLSSSIAEGVFWALVTPNGGETVSLE